MSNSSDFPGFCNRVANFKPPLPESHDEQAHSVLCYQMPEWIDLLIHSIKSGDMHIQEQCRLCDLLILDGLEHLEYKEATQQELLSILKTRYKNGLETILISDRDITNQNTGFNQALLSFLQGVNCS